VSRVAAQRDYAWPPGAAERLWTDPETWPAWVEGFGRITGRAGEWPEPGAVVEWDSGPHGRGHVRERVIVREPGAALETEISDDRMRGVQRVEFEPLEDGVGVKLELDYTLIGIGFAAPVLDALFIRRAIRDSLRRTLERFGRELAGQRL
jgi:Polyketide cyclase / dehydrase and lipid transport